MNQTRKYTLQVCGFLALILVIGTVGYYLIEPGWTLFEAFYMTVISVTTVGFGEIRPLTHAGRVFTIFLVFSGFSAVAVFATQFGRLVIEKEFRNLFPGGQRQRKIMQMKDHYIVCGFGEIASSICAELRGADLACVVIEMDTTLAARAEAEGYSVVRGNATDDSALKQSGIERCAGVIAVLPNESDNLLVSLAARELNPKTLIIARGEKAEVENRILRAGADIVVSPMKLGGQQIAQLIQQNIGAFGAQITTGQADTPFGLTLTPYNHPRGEPVRVHDVVETAAAVAAAAIHHRDGSLTANPDSECVLSAGETLVLLTRVSSGPKPDADARPGRKTILIADDHRALRELFARKVRAAGHEVLLAATGAEAIAMAIEHQPDLIVLDVLMPERSGYEVCETLKADPKCRDVPVILYSADETDEFIQQGRAVGADACLRKTSKSSELLAVIQEFLTA